MRTSRYLLVTLLLILGLFLVACGGGAEEPAAEEPAAAPAEEEAAPAEEEMAEEEAAPAEEEMADGDKVQIRWFVGLGTGTNAEQIEVQEEVVADFNASQDHIELVLEIVPFDSARDTLATQIASGSGPDIVGPVGWGGSNDFFGQWLDIAPLIDSSGFDTSIFDPALVDSYQTEEGQVGLPFAVFPGAVFYIPAMFDEVGLAYPPQVYGEQYELDGEMVDWNWETLTEVAKRLTIDINGLNATEDGFDASQIVQVGYSPQWQSATSIGTFYGGAAKLYSGTETGSYESTIPDSWKDAWNWYYEGMYGDQPYIASGPLSGAAEFGAGNVFNAGRAAMGLTQTWYTCCLGEFRDAGNEFQLAIQPAMADGTVQGRIDADTFRLWIGTGHPEEAFEVLAYLVTTGGDKLLPVYGAMPAIAEKTEAFFEVKSNDYPFVTPESWDVFVQGLAYPDAPSAEQYIPNSIEAYARISTFLDLMNNTEDLDVDTEIANLEADLEAIYNK
jgi:multiple sugar transport system substrate-binding protein